MAMMSMMPEHVPHDRRVAAVTVAAVLVMAALIIFLMMTLVRAY